MSFNRVSQGEKFLLKKFLPVLLAAKKTSLIFNGVQFKLAQLDILLFEMRESSLRSLEFSPQACALPQAMLQSLKQA